MDRISNLPNEILCHILSFLSAKEAAFTTILSKRWQNLITIVSNLEYEDSPVKNPESLIDFVDEVLALPITTRIRKFSLKCHWSFYQKLDTALVIDQHINRCLLNVLKRGVLNLELNIKVKEGYLLPSEIFTCNTVVKLELSCDIIVEPLCIGYLDIDFIPQNALLPALETLLLGSFRFSGHLRGCTFQMLLSACPVLKELTIYDVEWENWKWSRIVSSPTLERLTIRRTEYDNGFSGFDFKSISFDTPSLTYLEYVDFVPDEYSSVILDSLVEAKLNLTLTVDHNWHGGYGYLDEDDRITSNPTNLIKGLRNVEILHLSSTETAQTLCFFREAIPEFINLHHLTISPTDEEGIYWRFLPVLLKKTPNLKTFVIKGQLHYDDNEEEEESENYCGCSSVCNCLLSCPVKVLEISSYMGTTKDVEILKHFLGKLSCLKLVKLDVVTRGNDKEKLRITTDLLMLPRASVNCKIQIKFSKSYYITHA